MKRSFCLLSVIFFAFVAQYCSAPQKETGNRELEIKTRISNSLENDILRYWYPRVIDTVDGGYISRYTFDWKEDSVQDKFLVYETRHIWTTAQLYEFMPERTEFLRYSKHGYEFLRDHMWDEEYGGFYIAVDKKGNPMAGLIDGKTVYGQAFSLYGLAKYFIVSGDSGALDLARKEFQWMENGPHDAEFGGYFEVLARDGKPITDYKPGNRRDRNSQFNIGFKDFNSSIHLLEALSTLYQAWPDPLVKERLEEMLVIVRDKMIVPGDYLVQYFYADLQRVPGQVLKNRTGNEHWLGEPITFGHDIETAFLLLEAAESLGWEESSVMPVCERLVEHTLKFGWDDDNGGIFDDGSHVTPDSVIIIRDSKSWWAEVESLNTLLLMSKKVPEKRDEYFDLFLKQWEYIDKYVIDHTYGEVFSHGTDTRPDTKLQSKAHGWKASYHTVRALVHCLKMLEESPEQ